MSEQSTSTPPASRSAVFHGLTAAAAEGRFELQRCARCRAVQYPPREACHRCLSTELHWQPESGEGELISHTTLFHSYEDFFRARLPWRVGLISLSSGPTVVAHLHAAVGPPPAPVRVIARLDKSAQAVLIAMPEGPGTSVDEDAHLAEILFVDRAAPGGGSAGVRAADLR